LVEHWLAFWIAEFFKMLDHLHLTSRQQQVLRATVHRYIATAEPVGSKVIAEEYNLKASPATIRSAMGKLEKAGLLFQPHTSAGRVPSDSGYRIYVDQLIAPSPTLSQQVNAAFSDTLIEGQSIEALLRRSAQILASLSGYVTLVTMPQNQVTYLRHIQLLQVDASRIMLLVVTDNFATQSILMDLPSAMQPAEEKASQTLEQELEILSNFLSDRLKGKQVSELPLLDWTALGRDFQQYGDLLQNCLNEIIRRNQPSTYTHILVSGVSEILRQPEFSTDYAQIILHLLEAEQEQVWPLMFETSDATTTRDRSRVNVWIGSENPLELMRGCALVSATYHRDLVPVGSVGMLGPTRMMYDNAIALVEAAANYLSDTLA
jgi:heat-inducible transcriptional repressor